ncbi:MAG: hypothetical protein ACSHX6_13385 [Akkermansiaceae bacterium]
MPKIKLTPQEKKRLAYLRDHYCRGGESKVAWRRGKPLKKRKARHSYRRELKMELAKLSLNDSPELTACRRYTTCRQRVIIDWGVLSLRDYVDKALSGQRKIASK